MPRLDSDIRARLRAMFRVEADEHLEVLAANVLELEREPPAERARELVEATFREMHTLKGAARSVGLRDVEGLCQACESLLSVMREAGTVPGAALLARLDEAVRAIGALVAGEALDVPLAALVERVERAAADPAAVRAEPVPAGPPAEARAPRPAADGVVRMPTEKLDELLRRGDDLLAIKFAADDSLADAEALAAEIRRARVQLERTGGADAGELRALEVAGRSMVARLQRDRRLLGTAVDGVLEEARHTRMTPAASGLQRFPMMVRDLAREAGKEAEWVAVGGELEVDRRVLDAIKDPLLHLARNAVDHGIEPPDAREAAGKPRRGRVTATVSSLEGGRVEIVVEDDGRGLDLAQVREAARRAGLLDSGAEDELGHDAALALILRSGVSTSFVVTDVSGRGLGLAIVQERIERLGGELRIESRPGQGTSVRVVVPATIATFRGLPVRAGGRIFLLPVRAVERVVAPDDADPALPVTGLTDLLGIDEADGDPQACAVVRAGDACAGLLVEEVLGDREVLVKDLPPPLVHLHHVAGAGLMDADELVLILRPADLVAGAHAGGRRRPAAPAEPALDAPASTILVVDDALTTRAMERSLLELAGYRVEVAVDGLEAWTMLRGGGFDLVVSDVDMPRMDGFELTARIRADPELADLPVVLVTALEGHEDKERGLEAGASAYVVKSSFERSNLLETIRRLGVTSGGGE